MRAGDLDQRITIQTSTNTRGSSGEMIQTWGTWKTVWAQVQTVGGAERFYSPQLIAETSHKIKIRYLAGVVPTMRILWRGRYLDITYVDVSRQREGEMYMLCREAVTP